MSFIVYNSGFESGIEKKGFKKQRIILIYNYYIHISFFDFSIYCNFIYTIPLYYYYF